MKDEAPTSFVATYAMAPAIFAGLACWLYIEHYGDWLGTCFGIAAVCLLGNGILGFVRLRKRLTQCDK